MVNSLADIGSSDPIKNNYCDIKLTDMTMSKSPTIEDPYKSDRAWSVQTVNL